MNHGIDANTHLTGFKDRKFSPGELDLVREVVASCAGLSRKELAQTICELLEWKRPSGRLKWKECSQWLERLESAAVLVLPEKQSRRPVGSPTRVPVSARGEARADLVGEVGEFSPIRIERVQQAEQRELFRELVGRHHYLGHAVPFGPVTFCYTSLTLGKQ